MLTSLSIQNFALIRNITLELPSGFIVVTGETGAGKSLLVGALTFLSGGAVSPGFVRFGESQALVEGSFRVGDAILKVQRILFSDGRVISYINGKEVSPSGLARIIQPLLNITSQRSFSKLLRNDYQRDILDLFAQNGTLREEGGGWAERYYSIKRRLGIAQKRLRELEREKERAAHQLEEIEAINPQPEEDRRITEELQRLEHMEEVVAEGEKIVGAIEEEHTGLRIQLKDLLRGLSHLAQHDSQLEDLIPEVESALATLSEVSRQVEERCLRLEYSPERLEFLQNRLSKLKELARKLGGDVGHILERKRALEQLIDEGERARQEVERMDKEREHILQRWKSVAGELHRRRKEASIELEHQVEATLKRLGIPEARFQIQLKRQPHPEGLWVDEEGRFLLEATGIDQVEFTFSANPGQPLLPVTQIASGGELSRILLSLKAVLRSEEDEATLVLDEIDVGVSGRVAHLIGELLRSIGQRQQLIAITHLPQIAALADVHLRVIKRTTGEETVSAVEVLQGEERLQEVALLLSSGEITPEARSQAERLLGKMHTERELL